MVPSKLALLLLVLLAPLCAHAQFAKIQGGPLSGNCNPHTLGMDFVNNNIYECDGTPVATWKFVGSTNGQGVIPTLLRTNSPNCTTNDQLVQYDPSNVDSNGVGEVENAPVSSTSVIGVVISGGGCSGTVTIGTYLSAQCITDGQSIVGDVVSPSSTNAGQCDDYGASISGSVQTVGRVSKANVGAGTASQVDFFLGNLSSPGSSSNSGTINPATQYKLPYYSNSGSSNVLSADPDCLLQNGSLTGCLGISIGSSGQTGAITLGNAGVVPPDPASGNSTIYTDASGFFRCILPTGATCLLSGASVDSPYTYVMFPATSNLCTTYSSTGTTYCAQNGLTGSIDYESTDAASVIRSAIGNVSGICGTIFFKTGIYNLNSLVQENTGGFSNYYAIGIPGNAATNQFCTWMFKAEGFVNPVGGSPVQTAGVILNLTSTAINSVAAHTKIMELWVRPPSGVGAIGPAVFIENIDFRVPDNQRGCETQVDITEAVTSEYMNVNADTAVQPSSLQLPLEDASCTPASWGGDTNDAGGLIQLTTTLSGQAAQYMNNVNAWGGDVCLDIRGEHAVLINSFGDNCNHAIDYGVRGTTLYHDGEFIGSGWQESKRGLTLGSHLAPNTLLNITGLDIEDANSSFEPSWEPVYHALENTPGRTFGQISFTANEAGTGLPFNLPSLFDDATATGEGQNFVQTGYSPTTRLQVPTYFTDSFTRANASVLGSGWTAGSNLGISSNTATPNSSGTGVSEYWGTTFSSDQFADMTISTMNTNAGTYAQLEINQTGTDLGANRVDYEYWCSRSAGSGQYGFGKHSGGSLTTFASSTTATCATPPFTMEIRHQGSLVCVYMNGALDTNLGTGCAIDSSLSGGVPSIDLIENTGGGIAASSFVGGSLPPMHNTTDSIFGQQNGWSGVQRFANIGTATNCGATGTAASPSVASCAAANAGSFSCATNASGATCVVDTTVVTANSQIFVTQRTDTTTGTRLGVTCNTGVSTVIPVVTAVTAGTSFTLNLGTFSSNPECFSYFIVN